MLLVEGHDVAPGAHLVEKGRGKADIPHDAPAAAAVQMHHRIGAAASEHDLKSMNVRSIRHPSGLSWFSGTLAVLQATVFPSISNGASGCGRGAATIG